MDRRDGIQDGGLWVAFVNRNSLKEAIIVIDEYSEENAVLYLLWTSCRMEWTETLIFL